MNCFPTYGETVRFLVGLIIPIYGEYYEYAENSIHQKYPEQDKLNLSRAIAEKLNCSPETVSEIVDALFTQLHQRLYEYEGMNGDYIGEELRFDIEQRAFFHFLGLLHQISIRYNWDSDSATEYLSYLGGHEDWGKFSTDMTGWVKSKFAAKS